jgi:hypothetical protein
VYNPHLESLGCREIDRVQLDLIRNKDSYSGSINFQSRKNSFQSSFPLLSGAKGAGF